MNNMKSGYLSPEQLKKKSECIRKKALEMAVKAGAGHIASAYSCAEILAVLYYGGGLSVNPKSPGWKQRDRFILSKGHGVLALYAVLADLGFFSIRELEKFTGRGGILGGLAESSVPGIEAVTGSLGHGLSVAAGIAKGAKLDRDNFKTAVLLGDGECHEGSVWEAAMFAGYHRLTNLIAVIDNNSLSATDALDNYLSVEPLKAKWEAFGWQAKVVNGHSCEELSDVVREFRKEIYSKPLAVIAKTVKGKGVPFMESRPIWHYRVPCGMQLAEARKGLKSRDGRKGQ